MTLAIKVAEVEAALVRQVQMLLARLLVVLAEMVQHPL
jgi:hypothetical protein